MNRLDQSRRIELASGKMIKWAKREQTLFLPLWWWEFVAKISSLDFIMELKTSNEICFFYWDQIPSKPTIFIVLPPWRFLTVSWWKRARLLEMGHKVQTENTSDCNVMSPNLSGEIDAKYFACPNTNSV